MLRKLPSVALLALGLGLSVTAHPAQGASYAGGASYRICPVPQECCGHTQYQLQRQTVLQNVQETVYDTQQVPVRADRLRDGHAAEDGHNGPECRRTAGVATSRTRSSGRSTARFQREVHYTVQRPVTRTVWKDVTYTVTPAGARNALGDPVVHGLHPVRETSFKTCAYNVSQPVREVSYKDVCYTVCRPVQETVFKTVSYTVCRPVQETCYKTCVYTVCRPVQSVRYAVRPLHGAGAGAADASCSASPPPRWCRSASAPTSRCRTRSAGRSARPHLQGMPLHGSGAGRAHRDADLHVHGLPPGA